MSKLVKISTIPKKYSEGKTFEWALAQKGWSRMPGTGVMLFPYKENDGKFRTALDPNSVVYTRIEDKAVRESKQAEAKRQLEKLEKATRLKLDGESGYYNFGYNPKRADGSPAVTVNPFKLLDGDNIFDLDDPIQAVTYAWLSVHPRIASSLEAYNNGEYPADTEFYVKDEELEASIVYAKKREFNDAIVKFNSFSPDKKKKIARLCGLAVNDDTREEIVYNKVDEFLNQKEIQLGPFKGQNGLRIFKMYADLDDDSLYKKDLIEQAFTNQIFRLKKGKVYEGEQEIFKSREDLLDSLLDERNQEDVLALEKKLKLKKLATV